MVAEIERISILDKVYIKIVCEDASKIIEHQVKILKHNEIPYHLKTNKRMDGDVKSFIYDITDKISLMDFLSNNLLRRDKYITFLTSIFKAIQKSNEFLLYDNYYILETEYIYIDPITYLPSLIYIPYEHEAKSTMEQVRGLVEQLHKSDMEDYLLDLTLRLDFELSKPNLNLAQMIYFLEENTFYSDKSQDSEKHKEEIVTSINKPKLIMILTQVLIFLVYIFICHLISGDLNTYFGVFLILAAIDGYILLKNKKIKSL